VPDGIHDLSIEDRQALLLDLLDFDNGHHFILRFSKVTPTSAAGSLPGIRPARRAS
jgi:hypothetical protein